MPHRVDDARKTVASFTKEVNQRLAKHPLKTNGRLANRSWVNFLSRSGHSSCIVKLWWPNGEILQSDIYAIYATRDTFLLHFYTFQAILNTQFVVNMEPRRGDINALWVNKTGGLV